MYATFEKWIHYLDSEFTTVRSCKLCRGLEILTAGNLGADLTNRCVSYFTELLKQIHMCCPLADNLLIF